MTEPRFIPGRCATCDGPGVTEKTPLYCTSRCRQMAETIRYIRACHGDGRDQRPDVREAIQTRMAMVLGGGCPERERRLAEKIRAEVLQRAGSRCEQCGRTLDFDGSMGDPDAIATIQHVMGNSSDLCNLKAWCRRCNLADAQSRFVPVQPGSPQEMMLAEIQLRCTAPTPLRLCDDEKRWPQIWRNLNRQALEAMADEETYGDDDLPGFWAGPSRGRQFRSSSSPAGRASQSLLSYPERHSP